ncbi:MAG: T9SS type A sorting domain-containing protein [Chitinophagales bacterium]
MTSFKPETKLWKNWILFLLLGMTFTTVALAQEEDSCETAGYVLSIAAKNASCVGENTGNATVASTGCNCLYSGCTYKWSDGQEFHTAFDLSAGVYTVTVTHPNGCVLSTEVEVKEPMPFIENIVVHNATSCKSNGGGKIEVVPTQNAGPLSFEWSNGETTAVLTDVERGTYELKVTNFIGCEYTETIEVEGPEDAEVSVETFDSCEGENNGRAKVTISGGLAPYQFLWNDPNNNRESLATDLPPGEYQVLITDALECTYEAIAVVNETNPEVSISASKDYVCPNEEVELNVIGGVSFEVLNVEELLNKQAHTVSVFPTETTTYEVTIETETGCVTTETVVVHVLNAPQPNIIAPITSICEGQQVQLIATENSGATFTWSPTEGLSNPNNNVTLASPANTTTYTLSASNNTGCTTTTEITIEVSGCVNTSIEDWIGIEDISLFPNPNKGVFQLQFELTETKNIQIQLYNTIGQLLEQSVSNNQSGIFNQTFDLTNKAAGLYYLEVKIDGSRHLEKIMVY